MYTGITFGSDMMGLFGSAGCAPTAATRKAVAAAQVSSRVAASCRTDAMAIWLLGEAEAED
jgi:hypothetical protein